MKVRLGPLPKTDRVKLTIALPSPLKDRLDAYAKLHAETWNQPVDPIALIPYMLEQFMLKDKAFKSAQSRQARVSRDSDQTPGDES